VAEHIGSQHTEIDLDVDFLDIVPEVVRAFDEPFAVSSGLALYVMARETAKHVKVVLTGDGGDEVFAGYYRHSAIDQRYDKVARLPLSGLRSLNRRVPRPLVAWNAPHALRRAYQLLVALTTPDDILRPWRYIQMLYSLNEPEKFSLYTPEWAEQIRASDTFRSTDDMLRGCLAQRAPNRLAAWRYFDVQAKLGNEMLSKVDKATMAWGVEARNPFLDYRVVEYAMTVKARYLIEGDNRKRILKRIGERYVPKEVLYRTKQGFVVPLQAWFRDRLPPLLGDALSTSTLGQDGIFDPGAVGRMVAHHRADPKTDLSQAIMNVAMFKLWESSARPG